MPILFDHDPVTGMTQYFDYDPMTGDIFISHEQDVSGMLDAFSQKRNDPEAWKKGVKESFAHYATIPAIVELELRKKGIDINDKSQTKRIIQEIEKNYPYLKVTDAKLWRPRKSNDS